MASRARQAVRWLIDTFRLAGAMFYWNARKSLYVRGGRRGHCPCHHPSDDPIPGYVRCQAVLMWGQPARFGAVCPLLARTEHGWCCSAKPEEVRPYWGRVLVWLGSGVVAAYCFAVLLGFAALRWGTGVPVRPLQVFWPGKWGEIRTLQADTFFHQAIGAFRRGELNQAHLALTSARQRDPRHHESGLLMAQITMFQGSAGFSDALFEGLLLGNPADMHRTAVVYHDTLLAVNRKERLAELAARMAVMDREHAAQWIASFMLLLRQQPDPRPLIDRLQPAITSLSPHVQLLVEAEWSVASGNREGAARCLRQPFAGPLNLVYMQLQVERLASLGYPRDAQLLLDFYGPLMGAFDHSLAQYALDASAGEAFGARASFRQTATLLRQPAQLERVVRRLIERPSAGEFLELHRRVSELGSFRSAEVCAQMWVAALACSLPEEAMIWREKGRTPAGDLLPALDRIDFASSDLRNPASVYHLASTVTLPREVVRSLLFRAAPPAQRALP